MQREVSKRTFVTVGRAIFWRRRTTLVTRAVTRFEAFKAILRSKHRQMYDSLRRLFRKPQEKVLCCLRPSSVPRFFTHPPLIASNCAVNRDLRQKRRDESEVQPVTVPARTQKGMNGRGPGLYMMA